MSRSIRYDLVLDGGRVSNADGIFEASVAILDGRVAALWAPGEVPVDVSATERVDCSGRWVLPGGVDPHVHVGISFGDVQTPEDHRLCTQAALVGGTTTIVDFAIGQPGQSPLEAARERIAGARTGSLTDYALHGCYTDRDADRLEEIADLVELGVRTIKVYTTYRDQMMASDALIRAVMEGLLPHGGLTYVHAEDNSMIEGLMADLGRDGSIPFALIREARPETAEEVAVRHVLGIARDVGAPVYFVHQSTPTASRMTRLARALGVTAYSEICPHYVLLDESRYDGHAGECYTCCPPLRARPTVEALMRIVAAGEADTVASDHCAFDSVVKAERRGDLTRMPFGMPGVQTRLPLMLSELVVHRQVPMSAVVAMLCERPARLSGLYPRKGVVAVGADADLVVWDPERTSVLAAGSLLHHTDYTPFEGWQVHGSLDLVVRGGTIACRGGEVVVSSPGRYLESDPIDRSAVSAASHVEVGL